MDGEPGIVIWFTGLSGAGKSTVAEGVHELLTRDGLTVLILDGDDVRRCFHSHLGFSEAEVKENNRLIAKLCSEKRGAYDVIMVPIISPYVKSRRAARARLSPGFYEVFCNADLETVRSRDVKGLYAKADRGEMEGLIGFSPDSVYEPPLSYNLSLDTAYQQPQEAIDALHRFVRECLLEASTPSPSR